MRAQKAIFTELFTPVHTKLNYNLLSSTNPIVTVVELSVNVEVGSNTRSFVQSSVLLEH